MSEPTHEIPIKQTPSFNFAEGMKQFKAKQIAEEKHGMNRRDFVKLGAAFGAGAISATLLDVATGGLSSVSAAKDIFKPVSSSGSSPPQPAPLEKPAQNIPVANTPISKNEVAAISAEPTEDMNARAKAITANRLSPETNFARVDFKTILNPQPELIRLEELPKPPDLGTAYLSALYGNSYWEKIFFENHIRDDLQTSTRFVQDGISFWDYNFLHSGWFKNFQHIVTKKPETGETEITPVEYQKDIELPDQNKTKIDGVKVFDNTAGGIGLLEKIWLTTAPEEFGFDVFSIKGKFNPEILAEAVEKVYIVIDNNIVHELNIRDLFSGNNPLGGKIENGGYVYLPLLPYKSAQVYLSPPNKRDRARDALWYKVEAQDFDPSVLKHIPKETSAQNRAVFMEQFFKKRDTLSAEQFPIQERRLIQDQWTTEVETNGYSSLTFRLQKSTELANLMFKIEYPEQEHVSPVSLSLAQLTGMPRQDMFFSNRFVSVSQDKEHGGIKVKLNRNIPLSKGTKISLTSNAGTPIEIFYQHRPDQIGKLRIGIFNQKKERNESVKGRQLFEPIQKDFEVIQSMWYIDDPEINVEEFNEILDKMGINKPNFPRGYLEGNIYLLQRDGKYRPVYPGIEDGADSGFYREGVNSRNAFIYGKGHYNKIFSDGQPNTMRLLKADYENKSEMWALAWGNSLMKLNKGDRFLVMPGEAPYETARVQATLFGYYLAD